MSFALSYRCAALLLALFGEVSVACQICMPLPERTLADRLLASNAVVLAREDPARPFHFRATEILVGASDIPIDLFLNSQARRTLATYPERAMLLAHTAKDARWSALGVTNPEYERVVREILDRRHQWRPREVGNPARLDWFVPLLGHPDARLHELAYLEIGRAPYTEIRRLAPQLPLGTLNTMLDDPSYLEWRSLAILMLGESGRADDVARVRGTLSRRAAAGSSLNLAAWATALIAFDGKQGMERLETLYLSDRTRTPDELEAIIQALSVSAGAEPRLRRPAAEVYRRMIAQEPSMAPDLVHDLMSWQRWDFVEPMRRARADLKGDPLAAYALGLYLRRAEAAPGVDAPSPGSASIPARDASIQSADWPTP